METIRRKQIGHLRDLLRDHGIVDESSLRRLIDGKSSIVHGEASFKVVRADDLALDDEHRSYLDAFEFREAIFDCGDIRLQNSRRIQLLDCVVIGSLHIGNETDRPMDIQLDTVAVLSELHIYGNDEVKTSVAMTAVRARNVHLDLLHSDEVGLIDSHFNSTVLSRLQVGSFLAIGNQFGALEVSDCAFKEVVFPVGQFDMDALHPSRSDPDEGVARCNPLVFEAARMPTDAEFAARSRNEKTRQRIETLHFLAQQTETRHSKRDAAQLKYLRALAESRGWASRVLVIATGALIKPARIVGLTAGAIVVFALAYSCLRSSFGGSGVASLWDALYFSGLTFTTIGYGDITPLGWARALAVAEGLLGIALSSAFVVSMVRRYIE